ncbi:MAG TPA: hypothetical protein VL173_06360 [Vicinamibacterales bacterium]|jgi:hypothetical protein|nr:hypothetical protein [Vicinamibacterales bacterium]
MTEQELRELVRSVIARRDVRPNPAPTALASVREHASHALFVIPAQGETCIIEPAVTCNHCGYCKSYGH